MSSIVLTILLLVISNCFMTFAWYGHLKLQTMGVITDHTPLIVVILASWLLALPEYICQVNGNRMGFEGNGGPFTQFLVHVVFYTMSITIFTIFTVLVFKGQTLQWNHFAAFLCLVAAVYFVFLK